MHFCRHPLLQKTKKKVMRFVVIIYYLKIQNECDTNELFQLF